MFPTAAQSTVISGRYRHGGQNGASSTMRDPLAEMLSAVLAVGVEGCSTARLLDVETGVEGVLH